MASTSTRMLLLGAVQLFEPVNGYQIRRELVSWRVDEWAHINPGSIYSGREEFQRLFADAVRTHDRGSARGFTTALSLAPLVTREVFLALLTQRLSALDAVLAEGEALASAPA